MIAKPKHQRLVLVIIASVAMLAAVLLAMWGLQDRAAYFHTPAEVAEGRAAVGQPIRLGGIVANGSIQQLADGVTIRFLVSDETAQVPVVFRGIVPDLFQEGSGAVAEGRLIAGGLFVADNILAKHDERYMPPELGNLTSEHAAAKTVEE
jgi:cytochrome c-type biogenesis protein CcmE